MASYNSIEPMNASGLPAMRKHPLVAGSQKETAFIEHVDAKILHITRRYAKKFSGQDDSQDDASGYEDFGQCVQDLDAALNLVWISATPALQVPYLLSLAGLLCSYLPAFLIASAPTFRIIEKLDLVFSYLLQQSSTLLRDSRQTDIPSATDRVRIKSLVLATRITVVKVEAASQRGDSLISPGPSNDENRVHDEDPASSGEDEINGSSAHGFVAVGLSRVYRKTLELLGDDLVPEDEL